VKIGNEAISVTSHGFEEAGIHGVIGQRNAQSSHCDVERQVALNKRIRPYGSDNLLPRDKLFGPSEQERKDLVRLVL
jgi:hypothetical protein